MMNLRTLSSIFFFLCCWYFRSSIARVGDAEDVGRGVEEEAPKRGTDPDPLPVDGAAAAAAASATLFHKTGSLPSPANLEKLTSMRNRPGGPQYGADNGGSNERELIHNGRPTGGNKYPSLVSIWQEFENDFLSLCHGVMIADDIFVGHRGCIVAAMTTSSVVLVGDYDSSRPWGESVQRGEVDFFSDWKYFELTVGILKEPVTFPGFVPATINVRPDNPKPFQTLTVVAYGNNVSYTYVNRSDWPGPALEATMFAEDRSACRNILRSANLSAEYDDAVLCGHVASPDNGVTGGDDYGSPVFDAEKKLLGFTLTTGFINLQVNLIMNATYFNSDLGALACRVSRSSALPFPCPDFACPTDQILHGYPWVELPDFRAKTRAWNGFEPVEMTQYPPPGTILRYGTTREVNVTATDAANRTVSCTTTVTVPPVVPCGTVEMNVTAGSYNLSGEFQPNRTIIAGTLYKMKGILQSRLTGKGSVSARLRKGGDKYTGSIEFKGNRTKGILHNIMISSPFTYQTASEVLQVDLTVTNNTNRDKTVARYDVYCELLYVV